MKKERTNDEWIKHYRWQYYLSKMFSYIGLILPCLILVACNFNKYFPLDTEKGKTNFSISIILLAICLGLAIVQVAKKIEDKKIILFFNSMYWFAGAGITYLLTNIFQDITIICACIGGGILVCATLNVLAQNRKAWLEDYKSGTASARTMSNEMKHNKKEKKHKEDTNIEVVD